MQAFVFFTSLFAMFLGFMGMAWQLVLYVFSTPDIDRLAASMIVGAIGSLLVTISSRFR